MKCPICKKETIVEETEIPLYNGDLLVKGEGNFCKSCGEHFFDSRQADALIEKSQVLTKAYHIERTIRKSGRGYVIPLPKDLLTYYDAKSGEAVTMTPLSEKKLMVEFE